MRRTFLSGYKYQEKKNNNSLPDAGEPVGHQSKHTDQQDQNRSTVLQVVVQFPGYPAQTQQADHLQRAEQTADALRRWRREMK